MIEGIMYFLLGLLSAALVSLAAAPALWRRAVRLTRQRIEASVPMTLAEIQAEKDQIRADFAISTRRLELDADRLRETMQRQLIDLNRKDQELASLTAEHAERTERVADLERREAELAAALKAKAADEARAAEEIAALQAELDERTEALARLRAGVEDARQISDEQRLELIARDTEIENLRDALSAANMAQSTDLVERSEKEARLAELGTALATERTRVVDLEARIAAIEEERGEAVAELERRGSAIEDLRAALAAAEERQDALAAELAAAESARNAAAAEIAELTARIESGALLEGDNIRKAMAALEDEKATLEARFAALESEHERLTQENVELREAAGEDWQTVRAENALLRERLDDMADDLLRVARGEIETRGAAFDGLGVPADGAPGKAADESRLDPAVNELALDEDEPPREGTLAARVRALQHSSARG